MSTKDFSNANMVNQMTELTFFAQEQNVAIEVSIVGYDGPNRFCRVVLNERERLHLPAETIHDATLTLKFKVQPTLDHGSPYMFVFCVECNGQLLKKSEAAAQAPHDGGSVEQAIKIPPGIPEIFVIDNDVKAMGTEEMEREIMRLRETVNELSKSLQSRLRSQGPFQISDGRQELENSLNIKIDRDRGGLY
ncbi:hypothetical protein ABW19_dt0209138 [Dactylella cylindrospora]|nr:hypothetical protein ABW19_dt0209138 [Dactylella cylindrospora]